MTGDTDYPRKAWSILLFLAGDNDMDPFARLDLKEMQALPSDEHVHVIVQFDSRESVTYRYRIVPGEALVVGELGEVNTGDPASLTEFVRWGKAHFPAERTALIIWNHGIGFRDLPPDFDYSGLRSAGRDRVREALRHALFRSTLRRLADARPRMRGVAIDATDRDFLDNAELRAALDALPGPGHRVDLVCFDACLMSTVEIAYQLRGMARYMVASQETETGAGLPYHRILGALAAHPEMSAADLARAIVTHFAEAAGFRMRGFGAEPYFTQSALDLDQVGATYGYVQALVERMNTPGVARHAQVRRALAGRGDRPTRFADRDMVDLAGWCEELYLGTKGRAGQPFRDALVALRDHLQPGNGLVVANRAHGGRDASGIHGVSIYWPQEAYSAVYDELDFATSGWGRLISAFSG